MRYRELKRTPVKHQIWTRRCVRSFVLSDHSFKEVKVRPCSRTTRRRRDLSLSLSLSSIQTDFDNTFQKPRKAVAEASQSDSEVGWSGSAPKLDAKSHKLSFRGPEAPDNRGASWTTEYTMYTLHPTPRTHHTITRGMLRASPSRERRRSRKRRGCSADGAARVQRRFRNNFHRAEENVLE